MEAPLNLNDTFDKDMTAYQQVLLKWGTTHATSHQSIAFSDQQGEDDSA